ncbi:uncharacterized protein LOC135465525 [Liolophura sinensis]|uniref:uncharacterized protein LOC135465525 n=1 Tax=Liolophura sinensis TaxID=3198878 RepID=UPI003158E778
MAFRFFTYNTGRNHGGSHHHEVHSFVSRWPSDRESRDEPAYNFPRFGASDVGGSSRNLYDSRYLSGIGDFYLYGPHEHRHTHGHADTHGHRHGHGDGHRAGEDPSVLQVLEVDLCVEANTKLHHTDEYEITQEESNTFRRQQPQLVTRRGQPFDIKIKFNRAYDSSKDDLKLIFEIGDSPLPSKGTLVELVLSDRDLPKQWGAKIKHVQGELLNVTIIVPPTCYVGKWKLKIDVIKRKPDERMKIYRYQHKNPFYIIFNPWCKDDLVYNNDKTDIEEYVMAETGKIYSGSSKQISAKPWNFGQFQGNVLDCAIYVLNTAGLAWTSRGDPVKISRKLSAVANSPDDNGILVGNWSGNYTSGRSPLSWTGSEEILEKFYRERQPVKFGQCWVFSGVLTTLCRTLGIPARSVTNFASAHDTDGTVTIDVHWSEAMEPLSDFNKDSVWNFHVWNEVWMARPDLPAGYGGWQAIDATPQEASDGVYCCGPASLTAIRRGEVHLPYDGSFIFAEVNADKVHWLLQLDGTWQRQFQKNVVGKHISTKKKGVMKGRINTTADKDDEDREDVTALYKYKEGSEEERAAVLRAQKLNVNTGLGIYETGPTDVEFELIEKDSIFMGEDFDVTLKVSNKSGAERTVAIKITADVVYYTGVPACKIKTDHFEIKLKPNTSEDVVMPVKKSEYLDRLVDHCNLRFSCMAKVMETKQTFADQDDFRLLKPELTITAPDEAHVGEAFEAQVSFTNTLPVALTGCVLNVEGPGLQKPLSLPQANIPANQTMSTTVRLVPAKAGFRQIIVSFDSRQISMVDGLKNIFVRKRSSYLKTGSVTEWFNKDVFILNRMLMFCHVSLFITERASVSFDKRSCAWLSRNKIQSAAAAMPCRRGRGRFGGRPGRGRRHFVYGRRGRSPSPGRRHSPGRHSPGRRSPGRHSPRRHSPGRHSPGRHSPGRCSPGRRSPGRRSPGRHSPGRHSPGRHSPRRHSPGRHSPGRHSPGRHSPGRCSPGRHRPGGWFPGRPGRLPIFSFPGGFRGGRLPPWILPIGPGRGPCRERPTNKPHVPGKPENPDEEKPKDERPPTPEIPKEEMQKNMHVTQVDLHILTNGKTHHTDTYDCVDEEQKLVLRRGEAFRLTVTFSRPVNTANDKFRLVLEIGKNPSPGKGSLIRLPISAQVKPKKWGMVQESQTGNDLHLKIHIPADCIIGKWKLFLETKEPGQAQWLRRDAEPIFILFNPWCKDDSTYMEKESDLEEYVLNDVGCIYNGNSRQIGAKAWNFGQFEEGILEAAMFIMNKGFAWQYSQIRGDPVRVSRVISQMVNSNDDEGVVYGNWSGVYDDGTAPTLWSGSVEILQEYMARRKPVKYGQCWVYAGVTTTVCRAIGLPSRCVSNFQSAHDTDGNITIDSYFEEEGGIIQPINEMNEDSVWNFHVWNEAWMRRPDLTANPGYDGWQVIDATPQEASDGLFCCGPAPVAAIKAGDIGVSYDATFIFAEVNADRVYWMETPDGDFKVYKIMENMIGQHISTKTPDGQPMEDHKAQRLDITDTYKHPEGLDAERNAVIRASFNVTSDRSAYDQDLGSIRAELILNDQQMIGEDFDVQIVLTNISDKDVTVGHMRLHCESVFYIGTVAGEIKTELFKDIKVKAGESVTVATTVTKDEYLPHIAELNGIRMRAVGMITGSDHYFLCEDDLRLDPPKLELRLPARSKAKSPFTCKISLTNPLPVPLTNGILSLEGPGMRKAKKIKIAEIAAGGSWETEIDLTPRRRGKKQVLASFDCEELQDVTGSAVIQISPAR